MESEYNKQGKPIETIYYRKNGDTEITYTYEYDENGNLINKTSFDGEYKTDYDYEYNEQGNLIKESRYNATDISFMDFPYIGAWEYKYDTENRKISAVETDVDGISNSEVEYRYDQNGALLEARQHLGESYVIIKKYDDFENVLLETWYNKDGEELNRFENKYRYDDYGNWIGKASQQYYTAVGTAFYSNNPPTGYENPELLVRYIDYW